MKTVRNASEVADLLRAAGVPHADTLAALATPSIPIAAWIVQGEGLPPGASRFGGAPDVPVGFLWPTHEDRTLAFLAQLDLAEVRAPGLPQQGWLLFFCDLGEEGDGPPWGHEPAEAGGARVIFIECERGALTPMENPGIDEEDEFNDPDLQRFDACHVMFRPVTLELPDRWDGLVESAGISRQEVGDWEDAYGDIVAELSGVNEDPPCHHLLGHAQLVQGDMREQCQHLTADIHGVESAASEWQLLLQLDSDDPDGIGPGWQWEDCGRLYFWIRKADLAARAFDRAWMILQTG